MKTILFSAIAMALFFGLYWLTLRRSNLFRLRRFYLVGTLIVAMIIPFVSIETKAPQAARVSAFVQQIQMPEEAVVPQIEIQKSTSEPLQAATPSHTEPVVLASSWNWKDALQTVYLVGCAFAFILLTIKLIKTFGYYRRSVLSDELSTGDMCVRVLGEPDGNLPFSFLRSVFVNPQVFTKSELQQVLRHERTHIRQRHTWDLLFTEAVRVLQWFNPVVYLYAKELSGVHEYLADEQVLAQGASKRDYLELLYKQLCVGKFVPVGNSFRHLLTKKRILMMNQPVKRRVSAWWLLALVPITAGLLLVNCHPKTEEAADELVGEEVTIDEPVCENPDVMPEFPGGIQQYMDNLFDSMQFPEIAKQHRFSGMYLVRFIVEKNGKVYITNIDTTWRRTLDAEGDGKQMVPIEGERVEKGKERIVVNRVDYQGFASKIDSVNHSEIDRAFRNAPACKPALKDGRPVRCELRLPFFFVFEMFRPLGEIRTPEDMIPHIAHYTIDTIPAKGLVVDITSDGIAIENKK
ncbi:MAG: M56 family metallopeptidase [Bacteroidales bacterium]|nr:M56 family metallopeptidase [Bacteroidales bacterium]